MCKQADLASGADVLNERLIARALEPAGTIEARDRTISDLVTLAGGRSDLLEAATDELRRRTADRPPDARVPHAIRLLAGAVVRCDNEAGLRRTRRPHWRLNGSRNGP